MIKEVIQIHDEEITSVAEGWERNIKKRILWNLSQLNKPLKYIGTSKPSVLAHVIVEICYICFIFITGNYIFSNN